MSGTIEGGAPTTGDGPTRVPRSPRSPRAHVGSVLGMDVYIDPIVPTNLGTGTNQDVVLRFSREDVWRWESDCVPRPSPAPTATRSRCSIGCFPNPAMIPDGYLASLGQITGTGLVTSTFAS